MIKVWFDALTAKQARIAAVLSVVGRDEGVEFLITCRRYDYIEEVLDMYNLRYVCIGQHGESARDKLVRGIERQLALLDVVRGFDVHVSLTSPDAIKGCLRPRQTNNRPYGHGSLILRKQTNTPTG
jgi:Uncharacterized protein conserved in archaea